ncbi:unnamed protein product [Brachionus calyciflorus]|uniref:Uncharacterized protein n=1 Tax=Brachionus calyciflorus TaxID=104777 RepID=A0A813QB08_9BILA|nr:unnamed protein product [Brachionus calyciflorus]
MRLNELSDTRVLCGLINSFVPNLFPTEILLNDRWCINLVLRSIDKILMCNSTMDSEDLVEAEPQSICAFFCYIFMMFYKFRQCRAVVNRFKTLDISIRKLEKSLDVRFVDKNQADLIANKIAEQKQELDSLKYKYDIKYYFKWIEKVQLVKESVHAVINNKFKLKYDWFMLEDDITVANVCYNQAINLSLTNGIGFYKLVTKELIARNRQIIVRQRKTGHFLNELNDDTSIVIRKILKLPCFDPIEIDPKTFPNFDIFVECLSNNKILKKGTIFMYQVFPSSIKFYHNFLIKACVEKELEAVKRLVEFFQVYYPNFIDLKEPSMQNTALHICAAHGYFKIMLYLLDNYANVNLQNKDGNTPLMIASEASFRDCSKLLIEFGADVNMVNNKTYTVMNFPIGPEYKLFLQANIKRLSDILPFVMKGNYEAIEQVIDEHISGQFPLCTLRSRFVNGSTLLHTCCYYGHYELAEKLLKTNDIDQNCLSPNVRDYKGATPLHRANDIRIIKLLLDYGADVNLADLDGNIPLHVKCYGEKNSPSENDAIEMLIYYRANLTAKNKKKLMPIHMAAIQGRLDVIKILFEKDTDKSMIVLLNKEQQISSLSSPIYIALINNQIECAEWMIENGFSFKKDEPSLLLHQILTQKLILKNTADVIVFLSKAKCDFNCKFDEGNTALHYAACLNIDQERVIRILVESGAYVNVMNDNLQTPLFFAVKCNNVIAAATLLNLEADFNQRDIDGQSPFELIKDIDEWIKSDVFDQEMKLILKTYEYKQTRTLIRKISHKLKSDFTSKAMLNRRKNALNSYLNQHYQIINSQISPLSPRLINNSCKNIAIKL